MSGCMCPTHRDETLMGQKLEEERRADFEYWYAFRPDTKPRPRIRADHETVLLKATNWRGDIAVPAVRRTG